MNEEKTATTYKEYKNGSEQVAGLGRLGCYKALDYLNKLLKKDIYYSEELEDSVVFIESYINRIEKEKARWENLKNWIKSLPINEDNFDIIPECIYNEYGKVGITKKAILEKMIDLEEKQSDE